MNYISTGWAAAAHPRAIWRAPSRAISAVLIAGARNSPPWELLTYSPRDKRLVNQWAADHTMTVAGGRPILALDMYEHAYQMDYGAGAGGYVDAFMTAIRWNNVSSLFDRYSREA
jgi:Fe-Mn family superoxide dismutase